MRNNTKKGVITMAKYKMPFNQFKDVKRMSQKDFSKWLEIFAKEMWQEGYSKALENIPDGSIVINPADDMMVVHADEYKMREVLLSVPGVGSKLCEKIIDKVYEEFDGYIKEHGVKDIG